jgi:hypothetical protein
MIAAKGQGERLLRVVAEDVPSVAREAAWTLVAGRETEPETVWRHALGSGDARVQRSVLRLMLGVGKWVQLRMYLEAAGSRDAALSECATRMLSEWLRRFNNTFTQPRPDELTASSTLLEGLRGSVPGKLAKELAAILGYAGA